MIRLYNHLRDTLTTKGLASNESLALDSGKEVAEGSEGEHDSGGDKAGSSPRNANELNRRHDSVGGGTGVVGRDLTEGGIEGGRGGAYSQEKRDLDEENDESRCPRRVVWG